MFVDPVSVQLFEPEFDVQSFESVPLQVFFAPLEQSFELCLWQWFDWAPPEHVFPPPPLQVLLAPLSHVFESSPVQVLPPAPVQLLDAPCVHVFLLVDVQAFGVALVQLLLPDARSHEPATRDPKPPPSLARA